MQEVNLLSHEDQNLLLASLESQTNLYLPKKSPRLGDLTVHFYERSTGDESGYVFQIRWGNHALFTERHVHSAEPDVLMNSLYSLIGQHKVVLKEKIINYSIEQLSTIFNIELEPVVRRRIPSLIDYSIEIKKARKKPGSMTDAGWPALGISISWNDEMGAFREFVFPLEIDRKAGHFVFDSDSFIRKLIHFRDVED
jgi:hypothetical protein